MKSLSSESKPFQSCSTVEIPGQARSEERLSRSKLKRSASEPGLRPFEVRSPELLSYGPDERALQ